MFKRSKIVALLSAISVCSMLLLYFNSGKSIRLDQIEISTVQHGEFIRTSEGFGQFDSQQDRVLTTPFKGRVSKINFLSGQAVKEGDILFVLENTDLTRLLMNANMDYQRSKLLYQKLEIELIQQKLNLENDIEDVKSDLTISQLDEKAQYKLYQKNIVSELTYKQTKAKLAKIMRKLSALERSLSVFQENSEKQLKIESSLVLQEQNKVEQYQSDIERMVIKAPITGVIQQVAVTVGDSLAIGGELGRLGMLSPDIAKLKFSAEDAKGLMVGSDVELSYLSYKVQSKISRIEPELSDGYIVAYVDLANHQLPDAKIELSLVAKTTIEKVKNVTWVQRPVASNSQSNQFIVFKVSENKAKKQKIEVKSLFNHYFFIESGLKQGDKIITSNIRDIEHLDEIEII